MNQNDYDRIRPVIDMAGRFHLGLNGKLIDRGIEPIDALLAVTEAAVNLARHVHGGDAHGGIEWMRAALDVLERQLLAEGRPH